jgi:nitrogen-specific signal transduction histidine kinase
LASLAIPVALVSSDLSVRFANLALTDLLAAAERNLEDRAVSVERFVFGEGGSDTLQRSRMVLHLTLHLPPHKGEGGEGAVRPGPGA